MASNGHPFISLYDWTIHIILSCDKPWRAVKSKLDKITQLFNIQQNIRATLGVTVPPPPRKLDRLTADGKPRTVLCAESHSNCQKLFPL
jgi:hypothetical protein